MGRPAARERAHGDPTRAVQLFRVPSRAYARALNLREYVAAGVRLDPPVLDLGCGDGRFALALVEARVMPPPVASVDHERPLVREARRNGMRGALCADLGRLPIRSGVAAGVVSNFVLSSIHAARAAEADTADRALAEVRRVLRPGGRFVCSLATPRAPENLLGTVLLRRLGAGRLADRYVRWSNRRNDETLLLGAAAWEEKLHAAGFEVEDARRFFTPAQARWHAALSLLDGFALAGAAGGRPLRRVLGRPALAGLAMLLGAALRRTPPLPRGSGRGDAGCVLIVATAAPDGRGGGG